MCGIVAILSKQEPVSSEALANATRTLDHRGPDCRRQWLAPDGLVGLGHARLSIIDLTSGDQPIANEDGRLRIIVNGEFYGYERQQDDLEQRGHRLSTRSDSEVALHLYEEIGTQCLHHLRGEFAFALWDESNKLLFAARDRFGIKPLFYAFAGDKLYLASEIKALFAAGVPARWDHETYFQQLFVYPNQDRTLFEGVYQVPPGHYLLATKGHVQLVRYWDLDYPRLDEQKSRDEVESLEQLRDTLDEAVRIRLRADVPVASFLSGGIDSSAVLGLAARHSRSPIHAFNVAFDHDDYDEQPIARETAAHVGAEFRCVSVTQNNVADHLADAVVQAETLGVNWHGVARYLLCQEVHRAGFKVVLTGEGADELFAGYVQARQDLLLNNGGAEDTLRRRASPGNREDATGSALKSLAFVQRTLGFTPAWFKKLAVGRSIFNLLLAPDYGAAHAERDPFRIFLSQFNTRDQLAGREPLRQSLYLWTRSILPNYTLFAERLEMAHAVEARVPFLDHHVFELVRELPVSLLIRDTKEKYALREAARHVLTPTVYKRAKHPFFAPPTTLATTGRAHTLVQDSLRSSVMDSVPFFNKTAVVSLLDRLPDLNEGRRVALDSILLMLLSTCVLHRHYRL